MISVSIKDILNVTDGVLTGTVKNDVLPFPCTDTRNISAGDLFVAIEGDNFNGHDFVEKAFSSGADGALVRETRDEWKSKWPEKWTIQVRDTGKAFLKIAGLVRRSVKANTVAITGSNGKTSTKDICAAILSKKGKVLKTEGNLNNLIGLPITLVRLSTEDDFAVLELGMNKPGEIATLTKTCKPDIGLITNVNSSHMEFFSSLSGIALAKAELIDNMREGAELILNKDDPYFGMMSQKARGKITSFAINKEADVMAKNIVWNTGDGLRFDLCIDGNSRECFSPIHGRHNVYNILGAAAAAFLVGVDFDDILCGIAKTSLSAMRSKLIEHNGYRIYLDTYNANPSSTTAAVEYIQEMGKRGRSVIVLGDMLELGKIDTKAHRKITEKVLYANTNIFLTYGPSYKRIYDDTKACYAGRTLYLHCQTHEEIATILKNNLRSGDWLLIKGSRGMKMEKVALELGVGASHLV